MVDRVEVFAAIERERAYQDVKWGDIEQNPHTVGEWILILYTELDEAHRAWVRNGGDRAALQEILQVASVAIACMEQHGVVERWENERERKIRELAK